jgi:hypothetical protein
MALIVWKDWVTDATITDGSYGTEVVNSHSVENIKTRQLSDIARWEFGSESPDTQRLQLGFDFGVAKNVNFLAILGWSGAISTPNYNFDLGTSSFANDVYNGGTTALWTSGSNDAKNTYVVLDQTYSARYARVDLYPKNQEIIDIGRIWIGEAWTTNASMDFAMGVADLGKVSQSRSGAAFSSARTNLKTMDIRCFGLNDADFFGTSSDFDSFMEMDLSVGRSDPIIVIPRNDSEHERHRLGIYGHVSNNGPIQVMSRGSGGLVTEKRFSVVEER